MPRDLFLDADSGSLRQPRDLFADAPSQARPPAGMTPGSREYADWAASAARAGQRLPQVSPDPPPSAASLPTYDPRAAIVDAVMRGNPGTAGIWEIGKLVTNPDVRAAFGRDMDRLGNSLTDAIPLPIDVATNNGGINDVTFDPLTGKVQPFSDALVGRASNAAGFMAGGESAPMRAALMDTATGKTIRAPIRRALAADGVPQGDVAARTRSIGEEAVPADLGQNVRALAATGAALPGRRAVEMVETMADRKAGGNARVRAAVTDALGAPPTPSTVRADVRAGKQAVGPDYESALAGAAPVDATDLAAGLDQQIARLRGKAQTALQSVRDMLDQVVDPEERALRQQDLIDQWTEGGKQGPRPKYQAPLETDARVLHQVRQAIDGMLGSETDSNAQRVLGAARKNVDSLLADAVPGIKQADAAYADLAEQGKALETGQTVFDSSRAAIRPDELDTMLLEASPGVARRLSQGALAEIDRIVGTNANDRQALERLLKGDGDWNRQRLASLFGQQRADRVFRILENERRMAETEDAVLRGAGHRSAQMARDELAPAARGPGVVESALNLKPGTAAAKMVNGTVGLFSQMGRQRARDEIIDAIMGRGNWVAPVSDRLTPIFAQRSNAPAAAPDDIASIILRG